MIFVMQKNPLLQFGNVPIQASVVESCFADMSAPEKKIQALEKDGQLVRLKRGLYVVSSELSGKPVDAMLCANHIYGPSYVSLRWALRWYGLIPERVFTMTSVTSKRSRKFSNKLGEFSYYQVDKKYYSIGLKLLTENGITKIIASPEKALCDFLIYDRYVPGQSLKSLYQYLEEDIRFDMDELRGMDLSLIGECAKYGMKSDLINNLIKLINKL